MTISATKFRSAIAIALLILISVFAFRQPSLRSIPAHTNKPDFVFRHFSIETYNNDQLESQISAKSAQITKKNLQIALVEPHVTIRPNLPDQIKISASKGQLHFLHHRFDFQNAIVNLNFSELPTKIQSNQITYFSNSNKIISNQPVHISNSAYFLKGTQFEMDTQRHHLSIRSGVSGKLFLNSKPGE